ncbi:MAG: hypothetical protein FJY29_09225 [Betaproteobacteria bacterium]|nr:hypothetical protein [Betaproteobacteria bacterium]
MPLYLNNLLRKWGVSLGLLATVLLAPGCDGTQKQKSESSSVCGNAPAPSVLNGLFWLIGEPTGANVLCSVQEGSFRSVQVLAPESRDPILLNDSTTEQKLLVERFSGASARPSRATWFAASGAVIMQRGDWPQNAYSVNRISASQAVVTGFDFADLRRFSWSGAQSEPLALGEPLLQLNRVNPILTLRRGEWLATLDAGFDLQKFIPRTAKAVVFSEASSGNQKEILLRDSIQNLDCKNAFQFLLVSQSSAVVSCNPQYFGAVEGETVGVFIVELSAQGDVVTRALLSRRANQVQKIDLWGLSPSGERVFVGLKQTKFDDYNGKILESGWIALQSAEFAPETRFAGPISALSTSTFVCACQRDSTSCQEGEFLALNESSGAIARVRPASSLPFLSFATDIPQP